MRENGGKLTVWLIRHGKTEGNLRGSFVGRIDQPVAPEGREELTGLVKKGIYPAAQAVFSSPMLRCRQTAALLYPGREAVVIEGLRERCFGEFEGLTHGEIIARPGFEGWGMNEGSMTFPGGEELEAFYERCSAAFWETAARCADEAISDAAFVTHGGVIMALMAGYASPARQSYFDWACGNGCGYRLECDAADHRLLLLGELRG